MIVAARTIQNADWDRRYSPSIREWAGNFSIRENSRLDADRTTVFITNRHPVHLDYIAKLLRNKQLEQGYTSPLQHVKTPKPASPGKPKISI